MSWNLSRSGNAGDDQPKIVNVYWQSGANYAALYPPSRVYGKLIVVAKEKLGIATEHVYFTSKN